MSYLQKGILQKSTDKQLQEVIEAKKHSIVYDEDSLELLSTMYKVYKSSVVQRKRKK